MQTAAPQSHRADTAHTPVSRLHAHRNAVVQLQPSDVAEPEDDARSIGPADALSQLPDVGFGALT